MVSSSSSLTAALLLLMSLSLSCSVISAGSIYTQGTTMVEVHTDEYYELVDGNNRTVNVRCATYLTEHQDSHKFDKACFTSVHTDNATLFECQVVFGDQRCNRCNICVSPDGKPGYDLDCFNAQPAENTLGCDVWNDLNIQQVLVDTEFDAQPFVFNATADALQLQMEESGSAVGVFGGTSGQWGVLLLVALLVGGASVY